MQIPQVYPVFKREILNNTYSPTSYYLARNAWSIITFFIYPLITTSCMIWFLGLHNFNATVFWSWTLDLFLINLVGSSLGMTGGCIWPEQLTAILACNLLCILFAMGAGLLANVNSSKFVRFLGWVSPLHYGIELIMRHLLSG